MKVMIVGDDRESIIGDLAETFALDAPRIGRRRAALRLFRDLFSVAIHQSIAFLAGDRRLHKQMLFGLLAGTCVILSPAGQTPRFLVMIATLLWLATAALIEADIRSFRSRVAMLFCTYACALVPAFVWALATFPDDMARIYSSPDAFLRWEGNAVPSLGGAGVLASLILAPFATRKRSAGLIVMALPILAAATLTSARHSMSPNLFVLFQIMFPVGSWGPAALRPWNTFIDLAIWAAVAMLASRTRWSRETAAVAQ